MKINELKEEVASAIRDIEDNPTIENFKILRIRKNIVLKYNYLN